MLCELHKWHASIPGHQENYIKTEDFDPRENQRAGRRFTRHNATLGAGLVLDNPGLKGRERPELYETH